MSVVIEKRHGVSLSVVFFEVLPAALVVLLMASIGIFHVMSRVAVVKMGYELSILDVQGAALQRENDALRVELATLKSPSRLESIAKTQLLLVPPAVGAVIHMKDR
jgi:cell division protein FtsL